MPVLVNTGCLAVILAMPTGGYNVGKKRKKRGGAGDDDDDVGDFPENIYKISRVEACLGFRRAATAHACLARRSSN